MTLHIFMYNFGHIYKLKTTVAKEYFHIFRFLSINQFHQLVAYFILFYVSLLLVVAEVLEPGSYIPKQFSDCSDSDTITSGIAIEMTQILSSKFGVQPLGQVKEFPAASCDKLRQVHANPLSGLYWITNNENQQILEYCEV